MTPIEGGDSSGLSPGLEGHLPVVAVDIIQPAALFDHLDHSGHILPCGKAVKSLIFLPRAGDHMAQVPLSLQHRRRRR